MDDAKKPRKAYNKRERTTQQRRKSCRGSSAFAQSILPSHVCTTFEKVGFLKAKDFCKYPLHDRIEQLYDWLCNSFKIVMKPLAEQEEDEKINGLVTMAFIDSRTAESLAFSVFSIVPELPRVGYPFSLAKILENQGIEEQEKTKEVFAKVEVIYRQVRAYIQRIVENDTYYLNSQLRSHTIWFWEKFFEGDYNESELSADALKHTFEIVQPEALPAEVKAVIDGLA